MAAAAAEAVSRRLATAVRGLSGAWYGRHMAAAERAIRTRLPLVDLVLEVRDARVPAASAFEPLRRCSRPLEPDGRRVVVLNKADLADPSDTERWVAHIKTRWSCPCISVNSHNKESINELLSVVRSRIREIKHGEIDCTGTVLLVGIPNVGKSAMVNAMHQTGRIAAAEKGRLKHAIVSSHPGETRDISGYKVASHPNIYVLDTPGVLLPRFASDDYGPKLALTGAIKDSLLEEYHIAQFLLAVVNLSEEYRKWENLNQARDSFSCGDTVTSMSHIKKRQFASDQTQDFIVKAVRQVLFETMSSFKGNLAKEDEFRRLIDCQFVSLQEAFKVSTEPREDIWKRAKGCCMIKGSFGADSTCSSFLFVAYCSQEQQKLQISAPSAPSHLRLTVDGAENIMLNCSFCFLYVSDLCSLMGNIKPIFTGSMDRNNQSDHILISLCKIESMLTCCLCYS